MGLRLRQRWEAWWQARHRPAELWTLTQRNVYILPTRAGLAFGLTLLLLLVASINYQLSLGYALTFLLAGSAVASMHMAHASLRGLTLHARAPAAVFAGERVALDVVVTNPGRVRHGLGLGVQPVRGAATLSFAEIAAQGQSSVGVGFIAPNRGRHGLPLLRVESRFPFGLFRAWSVWRPSGQVWVYPRPEEPAPPLPLAAASPQDMPPGAARPGREFDGLRPWRRGDSLRQVAWKKMARSGELISRDGHEPQHRQLWLDWSQTPALDKELRLARLAAWVLQAHGRGLAFGLRLPGRDIAPAIGPTQRQAALQMLAEWE